ncbi:MAG: glutamate--tRNA ligase [Rhodobacteraceae bacterium]|nr:glutamate--tRNA ligase [Paracoccaceae bacterium]
MTTTRFAPSPTGYLHIGNLRPALMNYLIAKREGGTFVLRIDDTDQERSKQEYIDGILEDMAWMGLEYDRIEYQSKRLDRYAEAADKWREMGRLYEAFETPTELDLKRKKQLNMGKPPVYDRSALDLSEAEKDALRAERPGHWRFKLDHERIEWTDGILSDISIDAASVSDPVLIRGDGQVLYTLASVVDDTEMGITHVVRGSDHVTNTATQIQMIRALGYEPPVFAHHSLLTGPQGEALSKRLGTLALRDLREAGVQPFALLSLMARLGSSDPVELRNSLDELAEHFDLGKFGSAPTKFDANDLYPLTAQFLHKRTFDEVAAPIADAGVPAELAEPFWAAIHENITTLHDLKGWWEMLRDGAEPLIEDEDREFIAEAMTMLPEELGPKTWSEWTAEVKAKTGRKGKGLFQPLRKALTGQTSGPDMGAFLPLMQVIRARG